MVLVNLKKSKSGSSLLNVQMSHLNKMSSHPYGDNINNCKMMYLINFNQWELFFVSYDFFLLF